MIGQFQMGGALAMALLMGCTSGPAPTTSPGAASPVAASPRTSSGAARTQAVPPSMAPGTIAPVDRGSGARGTSWGEPVELTSTGLYGSMEAVTWSEQRWVAVGGAEDWEVDADGGLHFLWRTGRVWRSSDGLAWRTMPDDPTFAASTIFGIQPTSHWLVALGHWKDERADPWGEAGATEVLAYEPRAWRSADGATWKRITVWPVDTTDDDKGRMNALAELGDRLVAVGCLDEHCLFGPAIWVSDLGGDFRPAHDVPSRTAAAMYDVTFTGAAVIAVGGFNSVGTAPPRAAVWRSPDGDAWTQVDAVGGSDQGSMRSVARTPDSLIAVGSSASPQGTLIPAAWRSLDFGSTWEAVALETFAKATDESLHDVVFTGKSIVAIGWSQAEPWRAIAWVSTDGLLWGRIELPGSPSRAVSVADGPAGLIAVGGSGTGFASWLSAAEGQ